VTIQRKASPANSKPTRPDSRTTIGVLLGDAAGLFGLTALLTTGAFDDALDGRLDGGLGEGAAAAEGTALVASVFAVAGALGASGGGGGPELAEAAPAPDVEALSAAGCGDGGGAGHATFTESDGSTGSAHVVEGTGAAKADPALATGFEVDASGAAWTGAVWGL